MKCAFEEAANWAKGVGLDTGGGSTMARLLLCLYNGEAFPFDLSDFGRMDVEGRRLALAAIEQYARAGETAALRDIGSRLKPAMADYLELCDAALEARMAVRSRWRRERERAQED